MGYSRFAYSHFRLLPFRLLPLYIILLYNSVFKIHSIFNIEEHVLQIAYRNVVNYIVFYCACNDHV